VRAARNLLAAAGPAAALVVTWGALESPAAWPELALVALIGIAPAAVIRPGARIVAAVLAAGAGLSLAFAASPANALPWVDGAWLGRMARTAEDGLRAFEVVVLPFDPAQRPAMHALTQVAVLGFSLAAGLAVAARRPLLATAVVVVGGGWATASLPDDRLLAAGGVLLVASLWPAVVLRVRAGRDGVAAGAALLVVAIVGVGAASAGATPDESRLDWRNWSLFGDSRDRLGVRYIWDAQYGGIQFPVRPTTVLRIQGPRRAHYWRASTLDLFTADRWIENLYPVATSAATRRLPADPLLPVRARNGTDLVRQTVEVVSLDDDHVIAAGHPVAMRSEVLGTVFFLSGGVMRVQRGIPRGTRYTVTSYAPHPLPRELLDSKPRYTASAQRYLALDRTVAPPFGASRREALLDDLFEDERYQPIWAYRPIWNEARRLGARAGSPYEATLAVERWLRTAGGFRYEEQPPLADATTGPPLVDFVVRHRSGYCQHFAGTMALMLRMLGIPARVAVGFTSGKWDGKQWVVSDVDAHAWVEAWFDGFGWLPFDPTPGRGSFSASYTLASDSADTVRELGRGELLAVLPDSDVTGTPSEPTRPIPVTDSKRGSPWPLVLAAVLLVVPPALLVAGKAARRRIRYLTRDPRQLAGAARSELVDVLRDQGVRVDAGIDAVELRHAVERHLGVPTGAFAEAYTRARYGPPARAVAAAHEMRRELRTVLRVLREELGTPRRLRGALSLRSLRRA
jgi:protein-glutamine gamma-glutamyltransferase